MLLRLKRYHGRRLLFQFTCHTGSRDLAPAPVPEGGEHRAEAAPAPRPPGRVARPRPGGDRSLDEPRGLEAPQAVREDVRGDPLAGLQELAEAGTAEEQVPAGPEGPTG